jgi:hypothetical protein
MSRERPRIVTVYEQGRQPCRALRPMDNHPPEPCPFPACDMKVQRCRGCLDLHHADGWEMCAGTWP